MLDIEKTNHLKRKLESMKSSTDKQLSEENKSKVEKSLNSILTLLLRVTFIYFAHTIIFDKYALGEPFSYWQVFVLYWAAGSIASMFK